jgi:magnesium transporter
VVSGLAAAVISDLFDATLKAVVALVFFVPLVLTLAESVAMQTVTISLQTLHLPPRVSLRDSLGGEVRAGLLLGGLVAAIVASVAYGWLRLPLLAAVVGVALVAAVTMGALFGYLVPRLVRRLRLDPKIASGPAVLALTDVAAIASYLGLAAIVF